MLQVKGLAKTFYHNGVAHTLFDDLSFDLAGGERLALLGRNGQGKSTLIKLLGGVILPSAGTLEWTGRCSWPLGFNGGVHGGMTGMDNIRFLARLYGQPFEGLVARIDDFAELGDALTMPVKYFSSGMRARLAFGVSLAIEFDCYLIDEVISVGDENFQRKCNFELFEKRKDRTFVIASHNLDFLRRRCTRAIVIDSGRAHLFDDIGEAIDAYNAMSQEHQLPEALVTQLEPDEVRVETSAAQRVEATPDGARLHWPPGVFRSHEAPDGRCPRVFDLAGPARNLFFGPYLPLTRGTWRATIDLDLDVEPQATRRILMAEFGVEPTFAQAKLPLGVSGPLRIEIIQTIEADGLGQIRLWLNWAGLQGRMRFFGATLEKIDALPAEASLGHLSKA